MSNKKGFWLAQMIAVLVVYCVALMHIFQGHPEHRLVLICAVVMVAHLLEIPLAFAMLKGRNAQPLRVIVLTQLFGLIWWVPAKRGIFSVN